MIPSSLNRQKLLYVFVATTAILLFTFKVIPRLQSVEPTDPRSDKKPEGVNQPTATPTVPIRHNAPHNIPMTTPPNNLRPTPKPNPQIPPLSPNTLATQATITDQYMDLGGNGCHQGELISNEESLDVEVGCENEPKKFWLMWTTGREDWKLKHYRVIDNIFAIYPNAIVHILTKNMTADDFSFYTSNFKIIHHPLEHAKIFKYTPLDRWYHDKMADPEIVNHRHFFSHVTDAMRLALLWKYGGVYLDMDAILMKNIDTVRNAIGAQETTLYAATESLNGAVMSFDRQHPFLYYVMHSLMFDYNVYDWGSAGPKLLSRCAKSWAQLDKMLVRKIPNPFIIGGEISLPNEPIGTAAITVFKDPFQFYPIFYDDKNRADLHLENTTELINLRRDMEQRTFVHHYYNQVMEDRKKKIVPGTYLYELMNRGCMLACDITDVDTQIDDITF